MFIKLCWSVSLHGIQIQTFSMTPQKTVPVTRDPQKWLKYMNIACNGVNAPIGQSKHKHNDNTKD